MWISRLWFAAAVVLGMMCLPVLSDDTGKTTGQKVDNAIDRSKETTKEMGQQWATGRIHTMLTHLTESALTKNGFDNLANNFVDADRDRIKGWYNDKNNKQKVDVLNGRIAQFQGDWKAKYGSDFDIKKDDVVWGHQDFAAIALGEIGTDAKLAGQQIPAGDNKDPNKNMEKGRNVGVLTVKASHGLPELKVPLTHEMPDAWKIDVPDNMDGQKFYDLLLYHLTTLNDAKNQWPGDVNDAYRLVGHHVLMAVLGGEQAKHGDRDASKPIDMKKDDTTKSNTSEKRN